MKIFNWRKPVIYTLLYIGRRDIIRNIREIKHIERFSVREQNDYQMHKLMIVLSHAYRNVPYYKRILEKTGIVKDGDVLLSGFDKIPFLTKEIIRKEKDNLYSTDRRKRKSYENTSGGSTGEPVKFLQDKCYEGWNIATKLYFFNMLFKKEIGQPEACLWGSERDIYKNSLGLKAIIINFLYNRLFLNFFRVSDDKLFDYIKRINNKRPISMWAYVEAIDNLATFIRNKKIKAISPKFIISTIGTLYPEIRLEIEKVFSCPVYNQYGSRETGPVAIECEEKKGLHEFFWMNYVEIIDSKIYITSLNNFSMPLIRYDIGDIAEESQLKDCNCGRSGLKFKEIKGREMNFFKTVEGEIVHGQYFIYQFYFKNWIKKFQIVQKDYDLILCNIVLASKEDRDDMNKIEANIRLVMGKSCRIEWAFLDEIDSSQSGKYLYTICKI
jgi:phenylacetate-CoA ligase